SPPVRNVSAGASALDGVSAWLGRCQTPVEGVPAGLTCQTLAGCLTLACRRCRRHCVWCQTPAETGVVRPCLASGVRHLVHGYQAPDAQVLNTAYMRAAYKSTQTPMASGFQRKVSDTRRRCSGLANVSDSRRVSDTGVSALPAPLRIVWCQTPAETGVDWSCFASGVRHLVHCLASGV